jgi:hypothetical protein
MKTTKRRFGRPKTLRSRVDKRARTPQGALLELTGLTQERQRLRQEMERWEQRMGEIRSRLTEIAEMEAWLYRFVETPEVPTEAERDAPTGDGKGPTPAPLDLNELTFRY